MGDRPRLKLSYNSDKELVFLRVRLHWQVFQKSLEEPTGSRTLISFKAYTLDINEHSDWNEHLQENILH